MGQLMNFYVDEVCYNDNILAVGVTDILCENENPHITIFVKKGHKPVESNLLDWDKAIPFDTPLPLTGKVQICDK